jgi:lipopolysaccharide biosynthesis glycosyltransferase
MENMPEKKYKRNYKLRIRAMDIFENIILKVEQLNEQTGFEETKADFHVAFGIDKNFARGMGILIDALHVHNPEEKIVVHVFTDGINQSDVDKLKKLTAHETIIIKIYYIDINAFKNLPTTLAWSYATYYRFIMGKVLYGIVDKVLYIDADILCIGSLAQLKNIDMQENIVLAISEEGQFNVKRLGLAQGKYFNAGVLYIDINKWNDAQIAEKAVSLLQGDPAKYTYLDQDVLNILLDGKTRFIDRKWNYLYDMRKMNNQLPNGVILIHFIGDKPWQEWSQHHFMVNLYHQYAAKSPWADVCLVEPRHYKEKKRMARSYAKRNRYMQAFYWYAKYAIAKIKTKL